MRRRKKLIIRISLIILVIAIAVAIFFLFFKMQDPIETVEENSTSDNATPIKVEVGPNIDVKLPNKIINLDTNTITSNNDSNQVENTNTVQTENENSTSANETTSVPESQNNTEKKYEPLIEEVPSVYFVTLNPKGNNEVRILIGPDSEKLLNNNSDIKVGYEYQINNVPENIKTEIYFSIDNYDYPILLLLGESGKLYYVDIEKAYTYGSFSVDGFIQDIPEVKEVNTTTVENGTEKYRSAVITCTNGEGYEFTLSMIGR